MRHPRRASRATTTRSSGPPRSGRGLAWLALAVAAATLIAAVLATLASLGAGQPHASAGLAPLLRSAEGPLIVYSEFSHDADTIWAADPDRPAERTELARVEHAAGYGVFPSLSPNGAHIAYTVLPPFGPASPDAPAELRLLDVASGDTKRIAEDIDLRITPVWSPDSNAVVVRRSVWLDGGGDFTLLVVDVSTNTSTVATDTAGLYPIDFSPDGSWLYYVSISNEGTDLHRAAAGGGAIETVAHLSDDFVRDLQLSPDGTKLAFVARSRVEGGAVYTAQVLELTTGAIEAPLASASIAQFSPIWDGSGTLTVGQIDSGGAGSPLRVPLEGGAAGPAIPAKSGPGFDVPISWSAAGDRLALRSFEGDSVSKPGPSRVVVADTGGARHELSRKSDIIVAGWLEVPE